MNKSKLSLASYALACAAAAFAYVAHPVLSADSEVAATPDKVARGKYLVTIAGCNDCHTPPGPVAKYVTKAQNGFWHSFAFTTGLFPDEIQITPRNHDVTERACRKCHEPITQQIDSSHAEKSEKDELSCVRCHRSVGHLH